MYSKLSTVSRMPFLTSSQRPLLQAVQQLAYCNPFLPERIQFERAVLGAEFHEGEPVWSQRIEDPEGRRLNEVRIEARLVPLSEELRTSLVQGADARVEDLVLYEDAVLYLIYQRYYNSFLAAGVDAKKPEAGRWRFY